MIIYFCLFLLNYKKCISKWRSEALKCDTEKEKKAYRACPLCRVHSDYLIPSDVHIIGEEKKRTFDSRINAKKIVPCHEWTISKKCKFMGHCFYQHLDENGVDIKENQLKESEEKNKKSLQHRRRNNPFGGRIIGQMRQEMLEEFLFENFLRLFAESGYLDSDEL